MKSPQFACLNGSVHQDWETPDYLFTKLDSMFHFSLDVAASDENTKCITWFTERDNGLAQFWYGRVFNNPPYNKVKQWMRKASESREHCNVIVSLVPSATARKWFHLYALTANEIWFLDKHISFKRKGRIKPGVCPHASIIVVHYPHKSPLKIVPYRVTRS